MTGKKAVTYSVREHFSSLRRENIETFAREILSMEDTDSSEVVIDFKGIDQLPSMGIGALFALAASLKKKAISLHFENVSSTLAKLFHGADLDGYIRPVADG